MLTSKQILDNEMQKLRSELIQRYERGGKKVSGAWASGLEIRTGKRGTTTASSLWGFTYLAGRLAGKMPPVAPLLDWVKRKGIFSFQSETEASGIAWAIAKKIAREGTTEQYHQKIYEEVITPQRIQSILDKVIEINVSQFVEQVTAQFQVITKNV